MQTNERPPNSKRRMSEHLFAADFYFPSPRLHVGENRFAACNSPSAVAPSFPDLNLKRTDLLKGIRTPPKKVIAAAAVASDQCRREEGRKEGSQAG